MDSDHVTRRTALAGMAVLPLAMPANAQPRPANTAISSPELVGSTLPDETALPLPAQLIPVPRSLSPQGQAFWASAAKRLKASSGAQGAAQAELVTKGADEAVRLLRPMAASFRGASENITLPSGALLYRMTPEGRAGRRKAVANFDIHGGGFVTGGGELCSILAKLRAADYGVEVFSPDYRQLPDHPYPSSLDDCMAAYREVLKYYAPADLVVTGSSAGGNLAAALMLRAKDEGLPLPAALVLISPAVDLTMSGDSHATNRFLDVSLYGGVSYLPTYAGTEDLRHPYVSPLFGDLSKGWPRTFLMTGTRDLLLSDTVRMHCALRKAGVTAELYVKEASPHTGFMGSGAPEDALSMAECRRFIFSAWGLENTA